jgi:O-antigen/teichoic acid export membrane protein
VKRRFLATNDNSFLLASNVLGQVIYLVFSIFQSRLYSTADFGVFGLFTSIISIVSSLSSLKLEFAIISAETKEDAGSLMALSSVLSVIFSIIFVPVFFLFFSDELRKFPVEFIILVAWGILGSIFASVSVITRYWFIRLGQYQQAGLLTIWQSTWRGGLALVFFPYSLGFFGVVAGEAIGRGFGFIPSISLLIREIINQKVINWRILNSTFKKYRSFSGLFLFSSTVDILGQTITQPIILSIYGLSASGSFSQSQRVIVAPIALISMGIGDMFHSLIAEKLRLGGIGSLKNEFYKYLGRLSVAGLFVAGLTFFFGHFFFTKVFGDKWHDAGTMTAYMSLALLGQFVISPISRLIIVLKRSDMKIIFDVFAISVSIFTPYIANFLHFDVIQCVATLSIMRFMTYVAYLVILLTTLKRI